MHETKNRQDLLKLRDGEEQAIINIAVKSTLLYGRRYPQEISKLLPMWKETSLFERGIFLRSGVFTDHAPSWKVKKALRSLDSDSVFHGEYDRDFFQGLFDASSKMYINGTYNRVEFGGRKHLRKFLESGEHGQNIVFAQMRGSRKRLNRTKALPFMELRQGNDLDRWFIGVMCGSDTHMVNGEPMMKVKDVCTTRLDRLGVIYDSIPKSRNIMISCFYFMLYMADVPDFFVSYWISKIPSEGVAPMPVSSLVSAANWRMASKKAFVRDGLPFMLDKKTFWRKGMKALDVNATMKKIKNGFIDERIRKRCDRWSSLNSLLASSQTIVGLNT